MAEIQEQKAARSDVRVGTHSATAGPGEGETRRELEKDLVEGVVAAAKAGVPASKIRADIKEGTERARQGTK